MVHKQTTGTLRKKKNSYVTYTLKFFLNVGQLEKDGAMLIYGGFSIPHDAHQT